MTVRILLADHHIMLRDGLKAMLETQSDLQVVAETGDGREAVQLARELKTDIVILDTALPELNGIDVAVQIRATQPECRVIGLSMHANRTIISELLAAGARAYVEKTCSFSELLTAIREVLADRVYLSPEVTTLVIGDYVNQIRNPLQVPVPKLSIREREIVQMLAEGKSSRGIADILHLSIRTVENHRRRIMQKLGIQTFADLVKYAIREGLASVE